MLLFRNIISSGKICEPFVTNYTSVRWRRRLTKPFWLGLAKTKMFKIPTPKPKPPEHEAAEFSKITKLYRRQMRALTTFIASEAASSEESVSKSMNAFINQEIEKSMALNEKWNAKSALLREERQKIQKKETENKILEEVTRHEELKKAIQARAEEIVKTEIELSSTYITEENLDKAIEKCLLTVVDYNYAIDLSGNVFKGTDDKPVENLSDGIDHEAL